MSNYRELHNRNQCKEKESFDNFTTTQTFNTSPDYNIPVGYADTVCQDNNQNENKLPKHKDMMCCNLKCKTVGRICILIAIPIISLIMVAIFNAVSKSGEKPEKIYFSLPIFIFSVLIFIYTFYLTIKLTRYFYDKKKLIKREKDDDAMQNITIFAALEVLILSYYVFVLLNYASYLFQNSLWIDLLQTRTAYLVDIGTSHFEIFWIFIFYTFPFFEGVGLTLYAPVKFWSQFVTTLGFIWVAGVTLLVVSSAFVVVLERRDRQRSGEFV